MRTTFLLHDLVRHSASTDPSAPAVVDGERIIDYGTLHVRSNSLAHLLIDLGVEKGDRVGVYLDKSIESVVAIYGILKAGAAYVPFDPGSPSRRLAYVAQNAGISHLITAADKAASWSDLVSHGAPIKTLISLRGTGAAPPGVRTFTAPLSMSNGRNDDPPEVPVIGLDLAYVLYTSGSTGDPKGVMLTHQNALAFVLWAVDAFGISKTDRLSSHAPLHFDLSVFDLFAAAAVGAPVVLVPQSLSVYPVELTRFISDQEITVWYSVPSILSLLASRGRLRIGDLPRLRTVLFAGEVFPTKYLRLLLDLLPYTRFFNLFGPTETNVCTFYPVDSLPDDDERSIPIGKPIREVDVFAVTEEGRPAAPGEVGELYVRGPTVMAGYLGDPDRTAQTLLPNPFSLLADPVYRTGDLVKKTPTGDYEYLGRRDSQVKSRGYRIELGEIESALHGNPLVAECAVVAVPDVLVSNRVVAHVVALDGLTSNDLRRHLLERLPPYMVPERFEFAAALPRTSNGKVDRQALLGAATKEAS